MKKKSSSARYARGWRKLAKINRRDAEALLDSLRDIAPDVGRYVVEFVYGDVFNRPGLSIKQREMATIAALCALGREPQLKSHIRSALSAGCTRQEIVEIMITMAVYAGFPAALNGLTAARDVFAEL